MYVDPNARASVAATFGRDAAPWLVDLDRPGRPVFLPYRGTDNVVTWYALARTGPQTRELRDVLTGFVGPSHGDFDGLPATLDATKPAEAALLPLIAGSPAPFAAVFRWRVRPWDAREAEQAIGRLRALLERRPARTAAVTRPTGRLLREFEFSLLGGDWVGCERVLAELRAGGRLDAGQLAQLRVRALTAAGRWADALALPELPDLLTSRLAPLVTTALLQAAYHARLSRFEEANDPAGAVAHFRAAVGPELGLIFANRGPVSDPVAVKALAVARAAADPPNVQSLADLAAAITAGTPDRAWVDALAGSAGPPVAAPPIPAGNSIDRARRLYDDGEYLAAVALLRELPSDVLCLRLRVLSAVEVDDQLAAAHEVRTALGAVSSAVREEALRPRAVRRAWEALEALTTQHPDQPAPLPPDGWPAAVEALEAGCLFAAEVLKTGARAWPLEPLLTEPELAGRFAGVIASPPDPPTHDLLRQLLPALVHALVPEDEARPPLKAVYLALLNRLVLDDTFGPGDYPVAMRLAAAALGCGLAAGVGVNEYKELLDQLEVAWDAVASPVRLHLALDCLEQLIEHAVQRRTDVGPLLTRVAAQFLKWQSWVQPECWPLLQRVCEGLERPELFQDPRPRGDEEPSAGPTPLDGKSLVVYTVIEQYGSAAYHILIRTYPTARIELNTDDRYTDTLRQLARQSDVFVLNTWGAPHAVTIPIRKQRPSHLPLLIPRTKTVTSMVVVVVNWVRENGFQ